MLKPFAGLAALAFSAAAFSQTATVSPVSQQVQLLAPQLVTFAGSTGNFDSLVNGLTQGTPVTLATVGADGLVQIVTFIPGTTLSALEAARQLETARQNLIVRGVAAPTAQQLATALVGGTLTTVSGSNTLTGVLTGSATATTPIQVRNEIAPLSPLGTASALNLSATNLQALRMALSQGSAATLTTTSAAGATQATTFTAPTGPLSAFEVNQALQLASVLLAQQGIVNPTPDQIRVALLGGTLQTATGGAIGVQGVLQGRVRNTSDSPGAGNTSTSPFFGTSDTRVTGTSITPSTAVTPSVTPTVEGVRRPNTAEGANRARPGG
jgi:hypothetical protein